MNLLRRWDSHRCSIIRPTNPAQWRKCVPQSLSWRFYADKSPVTLRPYQEESIQAVLSHVKQRHNRLGLSLATGSGKTVVFTRLIERINPPRPHATQTLILAHRRELVDQAYLHCRNAYPEQTVEIELGGNHASGFADITVASMQSIISKDRIHKFDPAKFKLVLVDEAHHIVSPKYLEILTHFKLRQGGEPDSPVLVGVSATLSRFDGIKLGAALDYIVYHKDYVDMIGEKWLSEVVFTTVTMHADLRKVKSGVGGDFNIVSLSQAINTPENNMATFLAWKEKASNRKSTLIFCVNVRHIHDLTATFVGDGFDARFVTGMTPSKIRSDVLDDFRAGKFPVLLNCGVFTEGTDIPNIDCVVLARPTKSRNLLVQMIGRGTRLFPGKTNCHVIDMVASLKTGVVTTPTLFGLDPDEIITDAASSDLEELRRTKEDQSRKIKEEASTDSNSAHLPSHLNGTMMFTDYDSIEELMEDTSGEQHIRSLSQFAWVQVDDSRHILSSNTGSYLAIVVAAESEFPYEIIYNAKLEHRDDESEASSGSSFNKRTKKSPFARPRRIATAITFPDAVHAADKFASRTFAFNVISKHQNWRSRPASEAQLRFINQVRGDEYQLDSQSVTKGQATDMIVKLKHGGKGRAKRMAIKKRSMIKEQKKQEDELARNQIRVGALN